MLQPPKKILALKFRAMGDTVLMTAPLIELHRAFPQAEIHAAVSKAWAPLLENFPGVTRIWSYERHRQPAARAKALIHMGLALRRERYDCVVCFHASPSSAALAYATGARTRSIHFHGHHNKNRYSTVAIPGKGIVKPNIERDMDAVRAIGAQVPEGELPRVWLRDREIRDAEAWLARGGLTAPILGLGLGASRPAKSWPIERFAQIALDWWMKHHGSTLAVVSPEEDTLKHRFLKAVDDACASVSDPAQRAASRAAIRVESEFSLRQLAALQSRCAVFLGNDSGPRHLALAVGAPTVTLFGPEHPFEWHPYPKEAHPYFFIEGLACRRDGAPEKPAWCGIHECVLERHCCLTEIGVDAVMAECLRVARA